MKYTKINALLKGFMNDKILLENPKITGDNLHGENVKIYICNDETSKIIDKALGHKSGSLEDGLRGIEQRFKNGTLNQTELNIIRVIRNAGRVGIDKDELYKQFKELERKEFNYIIEQARNNLPGMYENENKIRYVIL